MKFAEWWKDNADGIRAPRDIAWHVWQAATAAAIERCAKVCESAAQPLEAARNQVDRHVGDVLARQAAAIRALQEPQS